MNYSRITEEADMEMKKPPVTIPPKVTESTLEVLDWTFEVTAPLYLFRGKFLRTRCF